jgi:hypothetical protein
MLLFKQIQTISSDEKIGQHLDFDLITHQEVINLFRGLLQDLLKER